MVLFQNLRIPGREEAREKLWTLQLLARFDDNNMLHLLGEASNDSVDDQASDATPEPFCESKSIRPLRSISEGQYRQDSSEGKDFEAASSDAEA
jgi:hypothetical protein